MAFGSSVLTHKKEQQIKIEGEFKPTVDCLCATRRGFVCFCPWSSVLLALNNIKEVGAVVDRPKALGDIRGVAYIYGMFYRFGLIDMPDKVNGKMKRAGRQM